MRKSMICGEISLQWLVPILCYEHMRNLREFIISFWWGRVTIGASGAQAPFLPGVSMSEVLLAFWGRETHVVSVRGKPTACLWCGPISWQFTISASLKEWLIKFSLKYRSSHPKICFLFYSEKNMNGTCRCCQSFLSQKRRKMVAMKWISWEVEAAVPENGSCLLCKDNNMKIKQIIVFEIIIDCVGQP